MKGPNSFEADEVARLRAILQGPAYAGLSAEQQLAALSDAEADPALWLDVPASQGEVQRYMMAHTHAGAPIWINIRTAAADPQHAAHIAAVMALDLVAAKFDTLDLAAAGTVAMLDLLVAGGVMGSEHKAAILALGKRKRGRFEAEFGRLPRMAWIEAARMPS